MLEDLSKLINNGIDSVFADYPIIVWQLLATLLLVIIVTAFFWKPITKFIDKEEQASLEKMQAAETAKKEADALLVKAESHYQTVKQDITSLEQKLISEAHLKADQIINDANKQATQKLDDVKVEIATEIMASENKIREAIKDVAILACEKMIKQNLNTENNDVIVDEMIEELASGKLR